METNAPPVILDNVTHKDLRVLTGHSAMFGDNLNQVLIFPSEFADIQREYPIFFRRNEAGAFQAIALLGFDRDENLFLDDKGWNARYIPAVQNRGPFLIGFRDGEGEDGSTQRVPMILLDPEHPRLSQTEGERLFLAHGGNAPQLERYTQALRAIHLGISINDAMFAAFLDAGILAPVKVEVKLDDTIEYNIPDLFSINSDSLRDLKGAALGKLHAGGHLALAFYVAGSIGNVARLIELKNSRRAQG